MKLRFCESEIPYYAKRFLEYFSNYEAQFELEQELTNKTLVDKVQQQEYLDLNLLKKVAYWKSPRRADRIDLNSESDVKEITHYAFTTQSERVRYGILQLLDGVRLPIASVILQFYHKEPYPIIDVRALWSIGIDKKGNNYPFPFWQKYVAFCRDLAKRNNVDMRTLDRALWQYSRENQ